MLSEKPLWLVLHCALTSRSLQSFLTKIVHWRVKKCFVFAFQPFVDTPSVEGAYWEIRQVLPAGSWCVYCATELPARVPRVGNTVCLHRQVGRAELQALECFHLSF